MISPIALAEGMRIGNVDFVSPDEIKALLDIEAPSNVAMNSGDPRPFPRINSYVLLPSDSGFLVAQIEWITIERSQYPKRKGIQDFGIIDLPFPLRKMSLMPLGMLTEENDENSITYKFSRGVEAYPTVGDPVLLPSQKQLKSIIESGENRRIKIGTSPLTSYAEVSVDPNRLFGRHLAVMGNTGSGKSCSVAGLIRWSIEAARKSKSGKNTNSRFIILDPNGEYATAFKDYKNVRIYGAEASEKRGIEQLKVPIWLWNTSEWCAFTQATVKTQRPTIIQALRAVKEGVVDDGLKSESRKMKKYLRSMYSVLSVEYNSGSPWGTFPKNRAFFNRMEAWRDSLKDHGEFSEDENESITSLKGLINNMVLLKYGGKHIPKEVFTKDEIENLLKEVQSAYYKFGGTDFDVLPIDEDIPQPFSGEDFLRSLEASAELLGTTEYVETLLMRVKTLLSDSRVSPIIDDKNELTLDGWLDDLINISDDNEESIAIIDLSLVPAEVVHILISVVARMTLEALQRYRRFHGGKILPTVMVMEEAHTFISRYSESIDGFSASAMCSQVFEKIAREGRKFGLGLVLSSQRPSELSPTVLSQCNTFLLHRISNDRDQELVNRLVPDNLRGLLRDLPSLPSQRAILLGWASELPVLVHMNYLKKDFRPQSDDPDFWKDWISDDQEKPTSWSGVSNEWQGNLFAPDSDLL